MKIVIFGGEGFIGSWLVNLLKNDHNIATFDIREKFSNYSSERTAKMMSFREQLLSGAEKHRGDVRNLVEVQDFINEQKPDRIVFLASIPFADYGDKVIQLSVEPTGMANVLKANEHVRARIVYMSSLFAIGPFEHATSEVAHLEPRSYYGIGKATCEHLIRCSAESYGIVRTTSIYGAGDVNNRVTQIVIEYALTGQGKLWVNNVSLLDFTYVKDLVEGIKRVIFYPGNEVFNIAGGRAMTLIDFIDAVEACVGRKLEYKIKTVEDRIRRGSLSNDKARIILNWEPQFDLRSGIQDTIQIYKEKINL